MCGQVIPRLSSRCAWHWLESPPPSRRLRASQSRRLKFGCNSVTARASGTTHRSALGCDTYCGQRERWREHACQILAARGLRGFWLGVRTTVTRAVVLGATNLGTYSSAKKWFASTASPWGDGGGLNGVSLHFCASVVAGFAIATTTAPIDFVRSRIMVARTLSAIEPASPYRVLIDTVREEGPRALYRGFGAQWARTAPYTCIQYVCWEQLCLAAGVHAV